MDTATFTPAPVTGFTLAQEGTGLRDVVDATGRVRFTGALEDALAWLHGVDLTPLRAAGWEVRFDADDGRPYIRKDTGGAGWCVLTPPVWPYAGPGAELRLCDWRAVEARYFEAL